MGGITVDLYLDDGDGVLELDGSDTLVTTTVTGGGGDYLFTGVTASGTEDYFVVVDPGQAAINPDPLNPDYVSTTGTTGAIVDINAGDALLNYDFGFQNTANLTLYTIRDRVWHDDTNYGDDDGETGITGVTVDLLDASDVVIATVTTDASGYFEFVGVPGDGADYTVVITDTDGVLSDYFGATPEAIAGEMDINNLTADFDPTIDPDEPNFGYDLTGSIGDTLFSDTDGDGVQDAGELGLGGVTVELWLDVDADGEYEPLGDDAQTPASLVTDASGNFIFSGLDDGTYFVHVDNTQAGLVPFDILTTGDDEPDAGHQLEVTITAGSTDMTADFGYSATTARDISGTLWEDANEDGVIDGGENGFANVTVDLVLAGSIVMSVDTDAGGNFLFENIPAGNYTVRVTDELGVLNGYHTTFEVTEGLGAGSYNSEEATLAAGDHTDIVFGYNRPVVTLVVLSSFTARAENGIVAVEWETASEIGTAGFYLLRRDGKKGEYIQLNDEILPGLLFSIQGGIYRYRDETAVEGSVYQYKLVEAETDGNRRVYGPFTIAIRETGTNPADEPMVSNFYRKAREIPEFQEERRRKAKEANRRAKNRTKTVAGDEAKILIEQEGVYYLDATDISLLLGISIYEARQNIGSGRISLTNMGTDAAYTVSGKNGGIYFFGEAIDSIHAKENVYWLKAENGLRMKSKSKKPKWYGSAPGGQFFTQTSRAETEQYPATASSDPESDYWLWDYVFAGQPGIDRKSFAIDSPGVFSETGTALLAVSLMGGNATDASPDHHVMVSVNGYVIGGGEFEDLDSVGFYLKFSPSLLNDGENSVEITALADTDAPYSIVYLDSLELRYPARYHTDTGRLRFTGEGNEIVTVSGFTGPDILVFDIADPKRPVLVEAYIRRTKFGYTATIEPSSPATEYIAVAADAVPTADNAFPDTPSELSYGKNSADYLVIAHDRLLQAAEYLADYRRGQGLETMVVDLQDVMDEFNAGVHSPHAIREFLAHAQSYWNKAPDYVVLAGSGTLDYKGHLGYGDNLMPPFVVAAKQELCASDNAFADSFGNDGIPEMAIGRIPAVSEDELIAYTDKIIAFESMTGKWRQRALMMADKSAPEGDFPADGDNLAGFFPADFSVDRIYLSDLSLAQARTRFFNAIDEGALFVNYFGHAGIDRLTPDGLLTAGDAPSMRNMGKTPVITLMTCLAGRFEYPGFGSLAEAMVMRSDGGAVAVWSSSGMSENDEAVEMAARLYETIFAGDRETIGMCVLKAIEEYRQSGGERFMSDIYNLLGDPALRLK